MNIARVQVPFDEEEEDLQDELIMMPDDEDDEAGGLLVVFGAEEGPFVEDLEFSDNLATALSEHALTTLANDLVERIDDDLSGREDWERRYRDGLKLLGINPEPKADPWPGAANAVHPVLIETAVGFQANAIMELVPSKGPAKFKVIGEETSEKLKTGNRVATELNYQLMDKMPEWRTDMERLLFRLPISGVVLKKTTFDTLRQRPSSRMVPGEDFIIQYGASDLDTCPRYTHRDRIPRTRMEALMLSGFYREIDIDTTTQINSEETTEAEDDIIGVSQPTTDERVEVYEVHADLRIPGVDEEINRPLPYIVTIETSQNKVLSIRRNWTEGDPLYTKLVHFVDYQYMPGFGWYGFGIIHLVGSAADAVTAILRQLIDAGTLANIPSGFKTTGFRVKGDETPVQPGEFRDVDVPSGKLSDALLPLPYKEPSSTSFQLMADLVGEIRRVASVADMKIGDTSQQTPVGTTLALLERSLRVMSAVHARCHASLKRELKLIGGIIEAFMPPQYEYDQDLQYDRSADFGGPVDIVPVSDPNSATQAQRIIVYQAAINIAIQSPQVYDMPRLHRGMLEVLGIPGADKIVPLPEDMQPTDPVSENMAILMSKPTRAFIEQDHEAHIRVHMAALQDPKMQQIVGQSPQAQSIMAAAHAHIQEHVAYAYRRALERKMGVPLPPPNEPLPTDTENLIAHLAAEASEQLILDHAAEAEAALKAQQMADPTIQLEANEQRIAEEDSKRDFEIEDRKIKQKDRELIAKVKMHNDTLASKEAQTGLNAAVGFERNKVAAIQKKQAPAKKAAPKKKPSRKPKG